MRIVRASILLLVLSCSAYAGEIGYGYTSPPPPPPEAQKTSPATQEPTPVFGEINNPEITEITLNLLSSVLSLF